MTVESTGLYHTVPPLDFSHLKIADYSFFRQKLNFNFFWDDEMSYVALDVKSNAILKHMMSFAPLHVYRINLSS